MSARRNNSLRQLALRSHDIIRFQPMQSTAVHGSGAGARVSQNSGGSGDLRVAR